MLITCVECKGKVSDHALACPHCGYPVAAKKEQKPKKKRRRRKLPNGFGSVKHLSGNRRNPYAAYPPTKQFKENGSPVAVPAIGYYPSYNAAYAALLEFNKTGVSVDQIHITFSDLYETFMQEYQKKDPSRSALGAYRSAYQKCEPLYDRKFAEIRKADIQEIFDANAGYSKSTTANIKKLFNQLYKLAIDGDVVDRNYAANVITGGHDTERGVPFTENEIEKIWSIKEMRGAKLALIMIYTGYRMGELYVAEIKGDRLVGGLKTKSGKSRIVPIHPAIADMIPLINRLQSETMERKHFKEAMDKIGLSHAASGEVHSPHDCRHTFSWLADKYQMDSLSKHLIMGHSLGNDVEVNTYGHRNFEQLKEEICKIKAPDKYVAKSSQTNNNRNNNRR